MSTATSGTLDVAPEENEEKEESMEELKIMEDDENGNEVIDDKDKCEDYFGAERLLMSSDSENESPQKKESKKKDSPIMDQPKFEEVQVESEDTKVQSKSKRRLIIESDEDSDSEVPKVEGTTTHATGENSLQNAEDADDCEQQSAVEKVLKKKYAGLVDTDSEEEVETRKSIVDGRKTDVNQNDVQHSTAIKEDDDVTEIERKLKMKYANLVDSESEPSDNEKDDHEEKEEEGLDKEDDAEEENNVAITDGIESDKSKKKPARASAKKALDDIQAIQSEQQRLHREAFINVPYHVPKKYTLKEFLNRRTIIKPKLHDDGSPAAAVVKSKRLKMSKEELAEYAKLLDERAKEATEFFKSSSESENDDNDGDCGNKPTSKNVDDDAAAPKSDQLLNKEEENISIEPMPTETTEMPEMISMFPQNTEEDDLTNLQEDVALLTTQPIITEVLELPKLDLNTLNITPERNTNTHKTQLQMQKSESIKRLINEHKLSSSPSLQGDANMIIDLESGDMVQKAPTGVDKLLQRLLATKARKRKAPETVSILSTENGKLEMSKVQVHITEEPKINPDQKPGAAFFKLKDNLKSIIKRKRLEEMQKKQEDEEEHLKCLEDDDEEADELDEYDLDKKTKLTNAADDDDNEMEIENECDINDEEVADDDDDECEVNDKENDICLGDDEEHLQEEDAAMDDAEVVADEAECDSDSDEDDLDMKMEDTTQRKNRIIAAFQDDSDDDVDVLKTQHDIAGKPSKLFDAEAEKSPSDHEEELLALCSGKFDETQKPQNAAVISQMPTTQHTAAQEPTDELLDLCSGSFETQKVKMPIQAESLEESNRKSPLTTAKIAAKSNKILSSDEENAGKEETEAKRAKKLTKRVKKRTVKLGFSDDEDDDENENEKNEAENDVGDEDADDAAIEEEPQTFVDYDSEENEILVQMTKKDCAKEANKFVENEAELSESDWGSADEDEQNMDRYDIELGDEEDFDREKLQSELGQIHARKMLDEDIREVRKFQEMFMGDEEEDGVQRQRQFKWKNAESGFSLDDGTAGKENDANAHESGDEENEQLWRKIRFEREQLLLQQDRTDDQSSIVSSNTTTIMGVTKKLNIISGRKATTTTSSVHAKNSSPFLITQRNVSGEIVKTPLEKKVRGSFLVRDRATLDKLASMAKGASAVLSAIGGVAPPSNDNAVSTVSVKAVKAKNFVFATLTEEEHENLKRKADDLMNSSSENGINYMKKPRIEPRRGKCLIDQLL